MKEKPSDNSGRIKIKRIIFSLIPAFTLLLLAELASRTVYYQMRGKNTFAIVSVAQMVGRKMKGESSSSQAEPRYVRLAELRKLENGETEPNEAFLSNCDNLVKKKYKLRTDENAFLLPSKVHENPDLVLTFFGGSTTECRFNEEENRFAYQTGRLLEARTGQKINSYNNGMVGITSMHALDVLINKIIPLQPDYAVLMENINDLHVLYYEGTYWNDHPIRSLIVDNNNPRFSQQKYAGDEWADVRGKVIAMHPEKIADDFKRSLSTFVAVCKEWGIQPVLMTQANRFTEVPNPKILGFAVGEWEKNGLEYREVKAVYDRLNNCIREVALEKGALLVDLAKLTPQTAEYMYDVVHFTDKGSLFVAEKIAAALAENLSFAKDAGPYESDGKTGQ